MKYKADSVFKNQTFNFLMQIINILFPLISIPYITRIFGPEILGKVNFANSIVQYFIMFASLGIPLYSLREISKVRENNYALIKLLREISILQIIFTIISFCTYMFFINNIFIFKNDLFLYTLLGIQILSNALNFVWFLQGIEKYKYISITNLVVKSINILLVFLLLKSKDDYYKYAFIISFCSILTSFINTIVCLKLLRKFECNHRIHLNVKDIKAHLYPIGVFFLSNIAINIYTSMDQTMLGIISGSESVGYYSMSMRIVKIILSFVTSTSIIMIPRISNSVENNNVECLKKYIKLSINTVYLVSIPCIFGIFAVGEELLLYYLGKGFIESVFIFKAVSILLLIIGLSNIFGIQIMIPYGLEKDFTIIVTISSFVNFFLNIILIPIFSYIGAVISTIVAEILVAYLMYKKIKNKIGDIIQLYFPYKIIISSIIFYILISLFIKPYIKSYLITIVISVFLSLIIYLGFLVILKENLIIYFLDKTKKYFNKY